MYIISSPKQNASITKPEELYGGIKLKVSRRFRRPSIANDRNNTLKPQFSLNLKNSRSSNSLSELISSSNSSSRSFPNISNPRRASKSNKANSRASAARHRPTFYLKAKTMKNDKDDALEFSYKESVNEKNSHLRNTSGINNATHAEQIYSSPYSYISRNTVNPSSLKVNEKQSENITKLKISNGENDSNASKGETTNATSVHISIDPHKVDAILKFTTHKAISHNISFLSTDSDPYESMGFSNKNTTNKENKSETISTYGSTVKPSTFNASSEAITTTLTPLISINETIEDLENRLKNIFGGNNYTELLSSIPISPARMNPNNNLNLAFDTFQKYPINSFQESSLKLPGLGVVSGASSISDLLKWTAPVSSNKEFFKYSQPGTPGSPPISGSSSILPGGSDIGGLGYLSLLSSLSGINSSPQIGLPFQPINFGTSGFPFSQLFGGSPNSNTGQNHNFFSQRSLGPSGSSEDISAVSAAH